MRSLIEIYVFINIKYKSDFFVFSGMANIAIIFPHMEFYNFG